MSSYYDVDAILTDAQVCAPLRRSFAFQTLILHACQKVPCTFELTVPGLGYLDGNTGQDVGSAPDRNIEKRLTRQIQMKQGTKVELPLWLGEMLAVR